MEVEKFWTSVDRKCSQNERNAVESAKKSLNTLRESEDTKTLLI